MASPSPSDDPGWRPAMHGIWWLLIPGQVLRQPRRGAAAGEHGLVLLRRVFLSFALAMVLIGVVVVVLSATRSLARHPFPVPVAVAAVAIMVVGAASLGGPRLVERPLDGSDDVRLAVSYRSRFFLRVAFSEVPALLGFAGFILTHAAWLYPLGAALTAAGFYRLAPPAAHLAQDQRRLGDAPGTGSLINALAMLPSSHRPGDR